MGNFHDKAAAGLGHQPTANRPLNAPNRPALARPIMIPASNTPPMQATSTSLNFMSRMDPASVPVQAPVPGSGMPTNSSSARVRPRPALASSARPPFSPLLMQKPDEGLMVAPDQKLPGKQVDEGHREHVAQHAQKVGGQCRKPQTQPNGNGSAQLHDGHHGDEKHQQIILEHSFSFTGQCPAPPGSGPSRTPRCGSRRRGSYLRCAARR